MDDFPFKQEEWRKVQEASHDVMSATLADDPILRQSSMMELERILNDLQSRYGDHPILRETLADFHEDAKSQVALYRSALEVAQRNQLPTLSIRMSLARVLLEDCGEHGAAAQELTACQNELKEHGDEADLREWSQLLSRCRSG